MIIRTALQLNELVDSERAWRHQELRQMRIAHDTERRDSAKKALRRAGIALLYAHLEGFVKATGSAYVQLVARSGCRYREVKPNFVAIGAKAKIGTLIDSSRGVLLCQVAEFFLAGGLDGKLQMEWDKAVSTRSNLSPEVFRDIIAILGLDYTQFAIYEKTVVQRVLDHRNRVAHGEYLDIDETDYHTLDDKILRLMDEFGSQVTSAAWGKTYKLA